MAIKTGTAASEVLNSTAVADRLLGLGGNDTLNGNGGNDTLEGGAGNDRLVGGTGNDVYVFAAGGGTDTIVEVGPGGGTDTLRSAVTVATLANHVENLVLTGGGAINGTGNTLNNKITGNTGANKLSGGGGNDTLDGGGGADTTTGGAGNDVHIVAQVGDKVVDSTGVDTVRASVTFTLGTGVEHLTLTGAGNINGTGNSVANTITGNTKNNTLSGAGGADKLDGGGGADTLDGGAGAADTLLGGAANDVLIWDAADAVRDGGANTDTLRVTAGAVDLASESIANMEIVDLAGTNTLTVSAADIQAGFTADTLTVNGGAGDAVIAGSGWTQVASAGGYAVYTKDGATLKVDLDINREGIDVAVMPSFGLGALDGANGFRLDGISSNDLSGRSVASAGDVNGDGYDDLIIGAFGGDADAFNAGESYVVFGSASGPGSSLALSALDGTNGFRLDGTDMYDNSGWSVASAGDVNGDGYDDLIIGAYQADPGGDNKAGNSYVVLGKSSFGASVDLSALDGTTGFRLEGVDPGEYSGWSVASAGDVNGDGYADLIIGARGANPGADGDAGVSYVVFGTGSDFAASVDLGALDGTNGFRLDGIEPGDFSGDSVASAGDVNGDGYDDLIIGAIGADAGGDSDAGASYVVFGKASGFGSSFDLGSLDGTTGFRLDGIAPSDRSGTSVASAGDVNGDGYADVIIGADYADGGGYINAGQSYVVFGKASGFGSSVDLGALDGTSGFRLDGFSAGAVSGRSVASAGDVNGDGYDDLVIGALGAYGSSGNTYVVFGKLAGFASSMDLAQLDGTTGFRLDGIDSSDFSGASAASAGDVNGDGFGDLIIGAYFGDPSGGYSEGETYVVYGRDFTGAVSHLGGDAADVFTGGAGAEVFVAGRGNDTITGGGGADVVKGGSGDDVFIYDAADRQVDGGSGHDTVRYTSTTPDDTLVVNAALRGIEAIVISDAAGDSSGTVSLNVDASASRTGLTLVGNDGNNVLTGTAWGDTILGGAGENTMQGGAGDDVLIGEDGTDYMYGDAGDDTLEAGAGAYVLEGGEGDDVFLSLASNGDMADGGAGDDTFFADNISLFFEGGTGTDTLVFEGAPVSTTMAENNCGVGFEIVDLAGIGNTLTISASAIVAISDTDTLRVMGGANDTVLAGFGWTAAGTVTIDGKDYAQFQKDGATVQVENDVDFSINEALMLFSLNGANGFRMFGEDGGDQLGYSVQSAGDIDGDGLGDIVLGAKNANPAVTNSGAAYIVYGDQALSAMSTLQLSALMGTTAFRIPGAALGDYVGASVSGAGDVNGDGFGDFIVGSEADPNGSNSGASYVVFGQSGSFGSSLSLSTLNGTNGFRISGEAAGDVSFSGQRVASAGDFNGDGYGDLLIGARAADPGGRASAGVAYVVYGGSSFASNLDLSALDGTTGFRIAGVAEGDNLGTSVGSAGDVNGDGLDDIVVGAFAADPVVDREGVSYVIFGTTTGFSSELDPATLDGSNGFRLQGSSSFEFSGTAVGPAGDVNGDGYVDLLIGGGFKSYVVFSSSSGFASNLVLSTLDGSDGFQFYGGSTAAAAGDVNGDGYDDLIFGDQGITTIAGYSSGAGYVVYGKAAGFGAVLNATSLDGENGFLIAGEAPNDRAGKSVSAAGDVNGDGFDDILVGAVYAESNYIHTEAGAVYVIYGGNFTGAATEMGTAGEDVLAGTAGADVFVAGRGDDTMTGGGGADVFRGGEGGDRIVIADDGFLDLHGGTGNDTLVLGGGMALDLTAIANGKLSGVEAIELNGSNFVLTLALDDVLSLSDTENTLTIDGPADGDTDAEVIVTDSGDSWGATTDGDYNVYTLGAATLRVHVNVDIDINAIS